jgi:predicted AlkP superfamily phosphohydrolase/phosphomutase
MNFVSFRPGSYELQFNNGARVRQKTLWRLLSEAGKSVGAMGVPMTYPPESVNGYVVAGLETPGRHATFTYPAELHEELRTAVGEYDLHGDFVDVRDPGVYLDRLLGMIDNQAKAACYLLTNRPTDLSVVVLGMTDRAQHCFWRFWDSTHPAFEDSVPDRVTNAMRHTYRRVDTALASMIESVPEPKNVMVVSDHGFAPCHKLVRLSQWLEERGHLVSQSQQAVGFSLLRGVWAQASRYAPRWLKDWLKNSLPGLRDQVASFLLLSRVDWSQTKAFAICTQHGYVYLNQKERFPQGIVGAEEAEALLRQLRNELTELVDPETGECMVAKVHATRDLYPGPLMEELPDLIVEWKEGYIARSDAKERRDGAIVQPLGQSIEDWSGAHDRNGILLADGPNLRSPGVIQGARLMDVAPTLLHLLGEPVPDTMSGDVLTDLFREDWLRENPVRRVKADPGAAPTAPEQPFSPEDEAALEERLRDLGYMD